MQNKDLGGVSPEIWYKEKIVLSQVFWVEIRNLVWVRRLLMVFSAFALASFALSPTAQGQLPFKPAPQGMYIFSNGYLSSSNQAASAAGTSINNANCDGVRWEVRWSDIEVTPNNYNWQYLDDAVAFAATNNKTCGISINAGTRCPEWLYAPPYNAQSYTLVDTVVVDQIPLEPRFLFLATRCS